MDDRSMFSSMYYFEIELMDDGVSIVQLFQLVYRYLFFSHVGPKHTALQNNRETVHKAVELFSSYFSSCSDSQDPRPGHIYFPLTSFSGSS